MGRPERPVDPARGPIAAFAVELRVLRRAAGNTSYRELSERALFSPSVLSSAASGYTMPTLRVALAFVEACGGDRAEWAHRWWDVARAAGVVVDPGESAPWTGLSCACRSPNRGTANVYGMRSTAPAPSGGSSGWSGRAARHGGPDESLSS